jgi:hypothetical protein
MISKAISRDIAESTPGLEAYVEKKNGLDFPQRKKA